MSVQPSPAQYEAVIIEAAITMLNRVGISGAQAQKMHNPQQKKATQSDQVELTDEQITEVYKTSYPEYHIRTAPKEVLAFARAVLAAAKGSV